MYLILNSGVPCLIPDYWIESKEEKELNYKKIDVVRKVSVPPYNTLSIPPLPYLDKDLKGLIAHQKRMKKRAEDEVKIRQKNQEDLEELHREAIEFNALKGN